MPLSPISAPNEITEIITNIGVLAVALGAAAAGVWKGLSNVKKLLGSDEKPKENEAKKILSAAIIETVTIQQWTTQNAAAVEQTRLLCNRLEEVLEGLRDHRSTARDFTDEVHKLRLAVSDLSEVARAFKR